MHYLFLLSLLLLSSMVHARPCEQAKPLLLKANDFMHQKQYQAALSPLQQAKDLCPGFQAFYITGMAYAGLEQWQQAMLEFQHARARVEPLEFRAKALAREAWMRNKLGLPGRSTLNIAIMHYQQATHVTLQQIPPWMLKIRRDIEQHPDLTANRILNNLLHAKKSLAPGIKGIIPTPSIDMPIRFQYNSIQIDADSHVHLYALGKALADPSFKQQQFSLIGHTDTRGSFALNQVLSERRAMAIRDYLLQHYPSLKIRLSVSGKGKTQLLMPGKSEADHLINRRVEVKLSFLSAVR